MLVRVKMLKKMQLSLDGIHPQAVAEGQIVEVPEFMAVAFVKQEIAEYVMEEKAFFRAPEIPENNLPAREKKKNRTWKKDKFAGLQVSDLAKELELSEAELLLKAAELDIDIGSPSSLIDPDDAHRIKMAVLGNMSGEM